jgi:hypothetical protein
VKTDSIENAHVSNELIKTAIDTIALSIPANAFSLLHNGNPNKKKKP